MPAALDNSYRRRFLSVRLLYYLVERMQGTPFTHSQRLQSMIERLCANLEGVVSLLVSQKEKCRGFSPCIAKRKMSLLVLGSMCLAHTVYVVGRGCYRRVQHPSLRFSLRFHRSWKRGGSERVYAFLSGRRLSRMSQNGLRGITVLYCTCRTPLFGFLEFPPFMKPRDRQAGGN